MHFRLLALAAVLLSSAAGCECGSGVARARGPAAPRYLKGQLHLHTSYSADSKTPPAEVARWYEEHGYDFIVFTDHDHVTELPQRGRMLTIPGVELTQNLRSCEPPPEPGMACLLHVNALFVRSPAPAEIPWRAPLSERRTELYGRALDATRALGGIAQLNHPNFHYAADAPLVATLARRGLTLLEIADEAVDSNNAGDDRHPGTEAMWDAVLDRGVRVWGTATDDAHHYYDADAVRARAEVAHTGDRGFVMVQANREAAAIREALANGRFYASNGVLLDRAEATDTAIEVDVAAGSPGAHDIVLHAVSGRELARRHGRRARFPLRGLPHGFVRVVVTDARGRHAWMQPVLVQAAR